MLVGAALSLLLVAGPLWLLGGAAPNSDTAAGPVPLAALATLVSDPVQFDISGILGGDWVGEMCPDDGDPVPVHFEFVREGDDSVSYSLSVDGQVQLDGVIGSGLCQVDGEEIDFHAFLAILSDCKEACGVDRHYEGHFEDGALVGNYNDVVVDEDCSSCVGGGTWWLEPEA